MRYMILVSNVTQQSWSWKITGAETYFWFELGWAEQLYHGIAWLYKEAAGRMQIKIVPDDLGTFLTILDQTHWWYQN